MTAIRHRLSALVALAALLSALGWSNSALAACPMDAPVQAHMSAMAGHAMNHHRRGNPPPAKADVAANCAACLAVLPALAAALAQPAGPFLPLLFELSPLAGIDPALDPPPPRNS